MTEAIAVLKAQGAEIVDPANIPSIVATDRERNVLAWGSCSGTGEGRGGDAGCSSVLKYGMKRDFNAWLLSLGPAAPVHTLTALREWNVAHRTAGAIRYGQAALDVSDEVDLTRDRAKYDADRARDLRLSTTDGLDAVIRRDRLDAVLFPGGSGASIAAKAGYPSVIVPFAADPQRTVAGPAGDVRRDAAALRRDVHRAGVQRAAADRAGVCVRASDPTAGCAAGSSVKWCAGAETSCRQRAGRPARLGVPYSTRSGATRLPRAGSSTMTASPIDCV